MANFDNVKKIPPVRCRILFILLCLPFVSLFAQTPLRTFEATAGAGFAYSADTASDYNYEALRELAREHLLEVHDVKLQFAVRIMISVFRDEDGKPYVSIGFRDTKVSGHTSYRGFDLSPFLVP